MSRRYPNRRHVDIDLRGERVRRRNLNRVAISIAVLFVLTVAATQVLPGLVAPSEPATPETTPPATASAAAGTPATPEPTAVVTTPIEGALPVRVVRIIDGDTLVVRSAQTELTVRLYGVDTPERGEACFGEAAERLEALAGDVVQLLPDARLQDGFGRELRYVYSADGVLIDRALVEEGLGLAWTEDGSFRAAIIAAEQKAQAAGVGCLWGPDGS